LEVVGIINETNYGSYGALMQTFFNGMLMAMVNDLSICNADNCPLNFSVRQFDLSYDYNDEVTGRDVGDFLGPILIFIILFLMLIIIATVYCVKFISIRESRLMTQLIVCGMRPLVVYFSNLLTMFIGIAVPIGISLAVIAMFDPLAFHGAILEFFAMTTWTCLFAFVPLAYLFSCMFRRSGIASKLLFFIFLILTFVPLGLRFVAIIKIEVPEDFSGLSPNTIARRVMSISPLSVYSEQFITVYILLALTGGYLSQVLTLDNLLDETITDGGACMIVTLISGAVYIIIGAIWDYFRYYRCRSSARVLPADKNEDEDVKKARQIAESAQPNDFSILLKNVRKEFKEKVADRNVSLAFPQSSCFALLGPNGAGKSTLVNMLTGQLRPNNGRVYIMGTAMSGQKANVFRRACMSLCMQDDTVLKSLTPRQHLMILHRTRCNCSLAKARVDVQRALERIGLAKYADQAIGTLSGGNCRKLSVATTMLPMTRVMVFDEPSTGMDPVTRRLMWTAIDQHKSGRCLLLTTHSMEEAEAVSDCIGIIAHGEMQCIGSVQHLRAKFNQNYHLSIDLRPDAQQDATAELVKAIVGDQSPALSPVPTSTPPSPGSLSGALWSLVESVGTRRTYELKVVPSMSGLFRLMESEKERFMIQSYSVAQASLEDIFLQLVRREEAKENPENSDDASPADGVQAGSVYVIDSQTVTTAGQASSLTSSLVASEEPN